MDEVFGASGETGVYEADELYEDVGLYEALWVFEVYSVNAVAQTV